MCHIAFHLRYHIDTFWSLQVKACFLKLGQRFVQDAQGVIQVNGNKQALHGPLKTCAWWRHTEWEWGALKQAWLSPLAGPSIYPPLLLQNHCEQQRSYEMNLHCVHINEIEIFSLLYYSWRHNDPIVWPLNRWKMAVGSAGAIKSHSTQLARTGHSCPFT